MAYAFAHGRPHLWAYLEAVMDDVLLEMELEPRLYDRHKRFVADSQWPQQGQHVETYSAHIVLDGLRLAQGAGKMSRWLTANVHILWKMAPTVPRPREGHERQDVGAGHLPSRQDALAARVRVRVRRGRAAVAQGRRFHGRSL